MVNESLAVRKRAITLLALVAKNVFSIYTHTVTPKKYWFIDAKNVDPRTFKLHIAD